MKIVLNILIVLVVAAAGYFVVETFYIRNLASTHLKQAQSLILQTLSDEQKEALQTAYNDLYKVYHKNSLNTKEVQAADAHLMEVVVEIKSPNSIHNYATPLE